MKLTIKIHKRNFIGRKYLSKIIRSILRLKLFDSMWSKFIIYSMSNIHHRDDNDLNILILNKNRFIKEDLESLKEIGANLSTLSENAQTLINSLYFSDIKELLHKNRWSINDSKSSEVQYTRNKLERYLSRILIRFNKRAKIDVIITCSFYYLHDTPWQLASKYSGIAFVVLHKENMKDDIVKEKYINIYKERKLKFKGQKLLVFNDRERKILEKARVCDREKISVTGSLRMDTLFNKLSFNKDVLFPNKEKVTLFSF